jgi:hypothetical protein
VIDASLALRISISIFR